MSTARKHRINILFKNKRWSATGLDLPSVVLSRQTEGQVLRQGSSVVAGEVNGVLIAQDNSGANVTGVTVIGGDDQSKDDDLSAVKIEVGAKGYIVSDNNIGGETKRFSDRIVDLNTDGIGKVTGNSSATTLPQKTNYAPASTNSPTDTALRAYTIKARAFHAGMSFVIKIAGQLSGAAAYKSLSIKLDDGSSPEVTLTEINAGVGESGVFVAEYRFLSQSYSTTGDNSSIFMTGSVNGINDAAVVAVDTVDSTTDTVITLYGRAVDASDSVKINTFEVYPVQDQFAVE